MDLRQSHSSVSGRIGGIMLRDLTPSGALYPAVFSTVGDDMLRFEWSTVPPHSEESQLALADERSKEVAAIPGAPLVACSSQLRLNMGSVRYVHTRRFLTQISNFMTQLQNMQQVMAQMRSMAAGIAAELDNVTYTTLLRLDIKIDSPVVVVPRNSLSLSVLEADLGRTTISSAIRLLPPSTEVAVGTTGDVGPADDIFGVVQCIKVDVRDMRLCSAQHVLPRRPPSSARSRSASASMSASASAAASAVASAAASASTAVLSAALVGRNLNEAAEQQPRVRSHHRRRRRVPIMATNLDDSEDTQPSGEETWSDSGSDSVMSSQGGFQSESMEVSRFELVSECSLSVAFDRNLSLERHDIPNVEIDVRVSNVDVQVCGIGGKRNRNTDILFM